MIVIFRWETLPNILTVDHIAVVESDDESATFSRLQFDALYRANFDWALRELLERAHKICLVRFVVGWNIAEIVKEAVLYHKQSLVSEYAWITTLFDDLGKLEGFGITNTLHL